MKHILTLALAVLLAFAATAQEDGITVTGRAEMRITPDRIYIKVLVRDGDIKGLGVEQIEQRMLRELAKLGLDTKKCVTVNDMDNALLRRNQVQTSKSYQVLTSSAAEMAAVYGALAELGIKNASLERVDHSDMENFRRQVRVQAVQQARDNARMLAEAIEQSIGPAEYIHDNGGYADTGVITMRMANKVMLDGAAEEAEGAAADRLPEFREIVLNYSVTARFRLNPEPARRETAE